jgi:hypothetical protein
MGYQNEQLIIDLPAWMHVFKRKLTGTLSKELISTTTRKKDLRERTWTFGLELAAQYFNQKRMTFFVLDASQCSLN